MFCQALVIEAKRRLLPTIVSTHQPLLSKKRWVTCTLYCCILDDRGGDIWWRPWLFFLLLTIWGRLSFEKARITMNENIVEIWCLVVVVIVIVIDLCRSQVVSLAAPVSWFSDMIHSTSRASPPLLWAIHPSSCIPTVQFDLYADYSRVLSGTGSTVELHQWYHERPGGTRGRGPPM